MDLKRLKVVGFKKIDGKTGVDLNLANVNILVGANGSGKSSVIQAVHLACCLMRQADRVDATKTSTVGVDELDYLPTDDYKKLGHGVNWGNKDKTPSTKVELEFETAPNVKHKAECTIRSARNAGISITGSVDPLLHPLLRKKTSFFSAYAPGISGIPNKEDRRSKKVLLKACSFGDSNVILRNALLQLKENDSANITLIETWLTKIIGEVKIVVSHDNDADLYVNCDIVINGGSKPLELAGTGYLQMIQIFCYVLLFTPKLLLIDEPDVHLHPHIQEKLVSLLAEIAAERGIKILLTTHSPFIVRGAPVDTNVYWLKDGIIESSNRELVEAALGWGAFGKRIIFASEDKYTTLLKKIISQWPEIEAKVAILPGSGYKNLLDPTQADELNSTLGKKFRLIVHRDRDSLSDNEVQKITDNYASVGVAVWFPAESDIEAYFCNTVFLQALVGCTEPQAQAYIDQILAKHSATIDEQFKGHRKAHNQELWPDGEGESNATIWKSFQSRPLKGSKGKFVFKQLKTLIKSNGFSDEKIQKANLDGSFAIDLKHVIENNLN
jgi:ABC-type dipeptide/oligopeptide/nickel transport system ATPase component